MHSDEPVKLAVWSERKNFRRSLTHCVRFEVLTAVSIEITLFWNMMPCTQVDSYSHFGERSIDWNLKTKAIHFSKMLVSIYWTTWCHISKDSNLGIS
jgi:hypothetical protein